MKNTLLTICLSSLCAAGLFASETRELAFSTPLRVSPAADRITLSLRMNAVSQGELVTVGETCELSGGLSDEALHALEQLPLGRASMPGQTRMLSQSEVEAALQRAKIRIDYHVGGALQCQVTAAAQTVPGELLEAETERCVCAALANDPDLEVSLEILNHPAALTLRPGTLKFESDASVVNLRPGVQTVRLHILQNSHTTVEQAMGLRLRLTGSVALAAHRLVSGDSLQDADIKTVRKELNISEYLNRGDASRWVGMRMRKAILADEMLVRTSFVFPPVIKRGEAVTVYYHQNSIELTVRGEARSDAALDEPVRVLITDSGSEIVGRATGLREVSLGSGSSSNATGAK